MISDVFILIAWAFAVGMSVAICVQVRFGLGTHSVNLQPGDSISLLRAFWASIWPYALALGATRTSVIQQYLRIISEDWFVGTCRVLILLNAIFTLWATVTAIFMCHPVEYFWNDSIVHGYCINRFNFWFAYSTIGIVLDISIAVISLPFLRRVPLTKPKKIALMAAFALGGATCLASIVRFPSLNKVAHSTDLSYDNAQAALLSAVEVYAGILGSCVPTLSRCASYIVLFLKTKMQASRDKHRVWFGARQNYAQFRTPLGFSLDGYEFGDVTRSSPTSWNNQHLLRQHLTEDWNGDDLHTAWPTAIPTSITTCSATIKA